MVTDGAQSYQYPKLPCENNLGHEACKRSKGIFLHEEEKEVAYLACAHGWYLFYVENSKGAVSSSWSKRNGGAVDPQLLQGIQISPATF